LIEDIQARNSSPQDPSVAYFYCDHSDPRKITTIGAVTTLLSQLLQANVENQAIIDAFALAMFESSSASAGSTEELWSLLDLVLQNLHGACFVIDGLDECDDYDCAELVQMLSQLSTQSHLLKVIIIGRSGCRGLVNSLSKHPTMEVGVEAIFQDILSYISSRIDKVFELGLEGVDSGSRETIVQRLGKSSNGMFLYARLMLDLLCSSALSPHQRAELFLGTELPEDLEQLYARALMVLRSRVKPERELAKRVFTWIACAQRNMRTSEIQIALAQDEIRGRVKTCDFIQNLTEILPVACAGLAEITPG
jgi:hypothetical protein